MNRKSPLVLLGVAITTCALFAVARIGWRAGKQGRSGGRAPAKSVGQMAQFFAGRDVVPEQRLAHFSWCDSHDRAIVGWYGQVEGVSRISGGQRVVIVVSPRLRLGGGGVPFTPDRFLETYDVVGDDVRFVGGVPAPGSTPGVLVID